MILAVSGGRDIPESADNGAVLFSHIVNLYCRKACEIHEISLVHGGARGTDSLVSKVFPRSCLVFPPDYDKHGKIAPLVRNQEMIYWADELLVTQGGGRTLDMIQKALKKNMPTHFCKLPDAGPY